MNKTLSFAGFLMLIFWASSSMAATCTSKASGNWSSSSTWSCTSGTTPGSSDTAIIASGNTVTMNITITVATLTINSGGTLQGNGNFWYYYQNNTLTVTGNLTVNSGGTFDVSGNSLTVNGNLNNSGTITDSTGGGNNWAIGNLNVYSGGTFDVSGNSLTVSGNLNNSGTITDTAGDNGGNNWAVTGTLNVNSGGSLDIGGNILTANGNITNNGTVTNLNGSGILQSTGNSAVISGTGSFTLNTRLYTAGTSPTIAAGSNLSFSNTATIRAGRYGGSIVTTSLLTINGTLTSTQSANTNFLRLYANSTVVSSTGVINAANSTITYQSSTATLTNNGSVTIQNITQNASSNTWTQGANAKLTVSLTSSVGTLYASANGNTVTYNGTSATDVTIATLSPANTYYNLAGTAVVCPTSFTLLGTSPCQSGVFAMTRSPTFCSNVTGIGSVAWATPANAYTSDNIYTTAANLSSNTTTNYLRCTGYNFAIPTGATINGIIVNVKRNTSWGTVKDAAMRLLKNISGVATLQSTDRSTSTSYTTSNITEAHGGATDLWSGTWTVTDINAANFGAAFAAYSSSTDNETQSTVNVDYMPITVIYTPTSAPDHVSVFTPTIGSTCNPNAVIITLHNAAHTPITGWGGTINLSTSDNIGDWSIATGSGSLNNGTANDGLATYTYAMTESSVTLNLAHTTTGSITLGVANSATNLSFQSNTPATENNNSINYPSGGSFSIITNATGTPVVATNLNQISGQASTTYYLYGTSSACSAAFTSTPKTIQFSSECNNPIACQNVPAVVTITPGGGTATPLQKGLPNGTSAPAASQYTDVSMNFNANSRAPFTLSYADAGKISLYMNYNGGGSSIFSGSNFFVVKPADLVLSGIKRSSDNVANPAAADATGTAFIKAGNPFSATVTALTASGASKANAGTPIDCVGTPTDCTPNFGQEVNPDSILLTPSLVANLGLTNTGTISGTFGAFSGGSASGTAFSWEETGIMTLTPSLKDADYLGAGDVTGTVSANIGRFYPDHFSVTSSTLDNRDDLNICTQGLLVADGITPCPLAFTYMGEKMTSNFTLLAQNLAGITTQNYSYSATAANNFAKLNPIALGSTLSFGAIDGNTLTKLPTARIDTSLITSTGTGSFNSGKAVISVPLAITRSSTADGPYTTVNLGIAPVDSDGVAMGAFDINTTSATSNDHSSVGSTEVRYGRLNLQNASGSELLDLPVSMTAQYWNGTNWLTNSNDNNTTGITLSATSITGPLATVCTWDTGVGSGNSGLGCPVVGTSLNKFNQPPLAGDFNLNIKAPGLGNTGTIVITATCPDYLKFKWNGILDTCPTARLTFGIYKGNSHFIYFREIY